jgi:hypothetical protein
MQTKFTNAVQENARLNEVEMNVEEMAEMIAPSGVITPGAIKPLTTGRKEMATRRF